MSERLKRFKNLREIAIAGALALPLTLGAAKGAEAKAAGNHADRLAIPAVGEIYLAGAGNKEMAGGRSGMKRNNNGGPEGAFGQIKKGGKDK